MLRFSITLLLTMLFTLASCDIADEWRLEAAVTDALAADNRTASSTFMVAVQGDGEVVITGEVYSHEEMNAVTEVAKAVPGVKTVLNHTALPEESSGMLQDTVVPTIGF